MRISDVLWVVHDEGEVGDEDGLCREGVLADCGWDGGGVEQGYRIDIRDPLHLSYGCLKYESASKRPSLYHCIRYDCLFFNLLPERRADVACLQNTLFPFQEL